MISYDIEERRRNKMRSDDRVIILKAMEGKTVKDYAGRVDTRLFTGENRLHGVYNPQNGMWNMKYQTGALPASLQEKFMTFDALLTRAKQYFEGRNVEVVGVLD